ncbi:unnamed protein product, partial [Mesorhabditis spiculigera]
MIRQLFHQFVVHAAETTKLEEAQQDPKKGSYEWKKAHLTPEQLARTPDNARYSGVPAIPTDIGYHASKDIGGKKESGILSHLTGNPTVPIGMGLTVLALLGMFKKSMAGDRMGAQRYMQYRIMAQFFTVTALVAGVTFFATSSADDDKTKKDKL